MTHLVSGALKNAEYTKRMRDTDPVLQCIRAELDRVYGDRLERVILFGSRARHDAHEDSDYNDRTPLMHNIREEGRDLRANVE